MRGRWALGTAAALAICLPLSSPLQAAVKKSLPQPSETVANPFPAKVELQDTYQALTLPFANSLQALASQGPRGYHNLLRIIGDEKAPMQARWRAMTALGRMGGELAVPELEKHLTHKQWYMRSSALIAISQIHKEKAVAGARRLLSDKALVVRATAVDVIEQLNDRGSRDLLWQKLEAKENYKGQQSLFIRRRIVETLAKLEDKGGEAKFIKVLVDSDPSLHKPAVEALERLTALKLGTATEPLESKRAHWQKWWRDRTSI